MTAEEDIVAEYLAQDPRLYTDEERDRLAEKEGVSREEMDRRLAVLARNWEDLDPSSIYPADREKALKIREERRRKHGW